MLVDCEMEYRPYTYRLTSSSSSRNVAKFRSLAGFGFLITVVGAVSSYSNHQPAIPRQTFRLQRTLLNQSDSSGLLARSSISSC
jgi:hypothetical protein